VLTSPQLLRMHAGHSGSFSFVKTSVNRGEISAVSAVLMFFDRDEQIIARDEAVSQCNFLRARDVETLPLLDRANESRGLNLAASRGLSFAAISRTRLS
jgi:hypothetical protein